MTEVKMESDKEEKKKMNRKRYDIPKTASCHVCGDFAAEHLHYGGIACYSCRAFFRRTVNSNRPMLDCSGEKNCTINKDTRKRCQWCRFEKCKEIGMKTSWVLSEDDKTKLNLARKLGSPKAEEKVVRVKQEIGEDTSSESGEAGGGLAAAAASSRHHHQPPPPHPPAFPGNGLPFYPNLPFPGPLFGQNIFGYHHNRGWQSNQHGEESRPWYPQYQPPPPSDPRGWLGTPSPSASASSPAPSSSPYSNPTQFRHNSDGGGFPFKNIQVSLSNPGRGNAVSLTIETRPGAKSETLRPGGKPGKRPLSEGEEGSEPSPNCPQTDNSPPLWGRSQEEQQAAVRQTAVNQQQLPWGRSEDEQTAKRPAANQQLPWGRSEDEQQTAKRPPANQQTSWGCSEIGPAAKRPAHIQPMAWGCLDDDQMSKRPVASNQQMPWGRSEDEQTCSKRSTANNMAWGRSEEEQDVKRPAANHQQDWGRSEEEQTAKRTTASHQQHSRTIFRHVSSDRRDSQDGSQSQDTSAVSAVSPPVSCSSPTNLLSHIASEQIASQRSQTADNPYRPQVWKLVDSGSPDMFGISFLQETLFLEQLSAIDERVRFQVPMDIEHSRAFLDCALTGKKITQPTVTHAYQTCIKRIVRFANSLQDFVELPPDDMHKLLVANTVNIINIRIARWFHPRTSLETQLLLCCSGVDLYKEATIQQDLDDKFEESPVKMDDVFSSPWCCDSVYEDRYIILLNSIHELPMDSTCLVLLSVLALFDVTNAGDLEKHSGIISHSKKFSLLLHRYLSCKHGQDKANEYLPKFQEAVNDLREMAEILINKRLIC